MHRRVDICGGKRKLDNRLRYCKWECLERFGSLPCREKDRIRSHAVNYGVELGEKGRKKNTGHGIEMGGRRMYKLAEVGGGGGI